MNPDQINSFLERMIEYEFELIEAVFEATEAVEELRPLFGWPDDFTTLPLNSWDRRIMEMFLRPIREIGRTLQQLDVMIEMVRAEYDALPPAQQYLEDEALERHPNQEHEVIQNLRTAVYDDPGVNADVEDEDGNPDPDPN